MNDVEHELRAALDRQARRIEVAPDALATIQRRTRRRSRWHRIASGKRGVMGAGAAVMATVVTVVVGLGSCTPTRTAQPPLATPAPGSTSIATSTGTPAKAATANVPIYYLGDIAGVPKLYREYHRTAVTSATVPAKLTAAITLMLDGRTAFDADYASGWPASATVGRVTVSGGVATVDLDHATVNGIDPAGNAAALQQLIWTATAFTGATGVRLTFDGHSRSTLWGSRLPVAGVLHRDAAVDVLAPVWVIDPQTGSTSGTHVTVHVAGIVFEAMLQVRIYNAHGTAVVTKSVHLSAGAPAQGTATFTVTLTPGRYTVDGYTVAMEPLKADPYTLIDGHPFTVK
ncbi:MAG TPA: GerMN domain-containing protein [Micromonosporaceae bacterium]